MSDAIQGIAEVTAQIQKLVEAKDAATQNVAPVHIDIKGDAKGRRILWQPAIKTFSIETPIPGWLNLKFDNAAELRKYMEAAAASGTTHNPAVFVSEAGIIFVHNMEDRRDLAMVVLRTSEMWQTLCECVDTAFSQKEFIRLLRIKLNGMIPAGHPLPNLVRNVKFTNDGKIEGIYGHGSESLGKSVVNKAMGVEDFPDQIQILNVQPFENHPYRCSVACAIEIEPANPSQAFRLTPFPLAMSASMEAAIQDIADGFLGDDMAPAYLGVPS